MINKRQIFEGKTKQSATQNHAIAGRYNWTLRLDLIQVEASTILRKYERAWGQDDDNRCNYLKNRMWPWHGWRPKKIILAESKDI